MNKATLNQQLDNYFKDLQRLAFKDLQARINLATQYPDFEKNEKQLRDLEVRLAKATAYGEDTALLKKECKNANAIRQQLIKKYNLDLEMHYQCDSCNDSGFTQSSPCICRQKKYIQILKESCSASRLSDFSFADNKIATMQKSVSQQKIFLSLYDIMQKVCDKFDTTALMCFLIMGEVGIGKSSLATATANELLNKGKTVLYLTAFEINAIFLKHHLSNIVSEDIAFDSLFDCDFLIIDDLGTEPIYNNVSMQYLFSTIDTRILNKKKTMVCTNLSANTFITRYGERALSRLTDKRYALRLDYIVGDDLRKIKM